MILQRIIEICEKINTSLFVEILRYPFYTLGDFHISIWLLLKAGLLFWLFIQFSKIIERILCSHFFPKMKLEESVQYTLSIFVKYTLILTGFFVVINLLGIKPHALAVVAGTIGIGIGLGLQDIAKNFISGMIILVERPIKVSDYIEVSGIPGRVRAIKARGTVVDTFDNTSVIVPNSDFISHPITNWSYSDRRIRITATVGVSYGSDVEKVKTSLLQAANEHDKVKKSPAPYVYFEEFGESALTFKLHAWIEEPQNRIGVRSDINFNIDRIFRENNITIAFPQRDLHIKSSDVKSFSN